MESNSEKGESISEEKQKEYEDVTPIEEAIHARYRKKEEEEKALINKIEERTFNQEGIRQMLEGARAAGDTKREKIASDALQASNISLAIEQGELTAMKSKKEFLQKEYEERKKKRLEENHA